MVVDRALDATLGSRCRRRSLVLIAVRRLEAAGVDLVEMGCRRASLGSRRCGSEGYRIVAHLSLILQP